MLARGLDTVCKVADEIVIVDTGSTDNTINIAKNYTDKIFHFDWVNDFSAARNFADSKAVYEYVFRWDADWVLRDSENAIKKIKDLKIRHFDDADLINFLWNLEFSSNNQPISFQTYNFIYKPSLFQWNLKIHEVIKLKNDKYKPKTLTLTDISIDNQKDPNRKWRYDQDLIIIKEMSEQNPNDLKSLVHYVETLFHQKKYLEVLDITEKYSDYKRYQLHFSLNLFEKKILSLMQINNLNEAIREIDSNPKFLFDPRIFLLKADLISKIDLDQSVKLYLDFIALNIQGQELRIAYDLERFATHPNLAVAKIKFYQKDYKSAIKFFKNVVNISKEPKTRIQARISILISGFFSIFQK